VFVPYFPLRADHPAQGAVADEHGASHEQIALAWLLHRSPMMLPIPGTLSIDHLRDNIAALDIELDAEEFAALSTAG
jgi:aryl-alcohol dehydrogenase-like predicted oxidoreductase